MICRTPWQDARAAGLAPLGQRFEGPERAALSVALGCGRRGKAPVVAPPELEEGLVADVAGRCPEREGFAWPEWWCE